MNRWSSLLDSFLQTFKEMTEKMGMSRTNKDQNWSYSQLFTAAEMETTAGKRDSLAQARAMWESTAEDNKYKVKKTAAPTESLTPMWQDAEGNWTAGNPGRPADGFKVTISGPTA